MLQSPVLASLFSVSCPFLAAVAAGIQYINMHFCQAHRRLTTVSKLCWQSQFHQTLRFKEHLIHHEKYQPQPADSHESVPQISYSIQPASIFMAAGWILKQEHSFAEICLLFSQGAANAVVTGTSERKSRRDV